MIYRLLTCFLVLCSVVFSSCKKQIIETIPVVTYTDISIPNAGDIKYFSFPSINVGYAASDTSFIYKTIDAGKTWNIIKNNNWSSRRCQGIIFSDEHNGFCLVGGTAYSTADGGVTWDITLPWYYSSSIPAFCGMTSNGVCIIGRAETYSSSVKLFQSTDKGQTFSLFDKISWAGGNFKSGRVSGDFISALNTLDNDISGLTYTASQPIQWELGGMGDLSDFFYQEGTSGIAIGSKGNLTKCYSAYSSYFAPIHQYDYYSIDGRNGVIVAVGDHTIVTNLDIDSEEEWNHVLDVKGNGFTQKFLTIRFTGDRQFYISGENGLIWRASI